MRICGLPLATTVLFFSFLPATVIAQQRFQERADSFLTEYAQSNKFWGTVLVAREGRIEFQKAYGKANIGWGVPNSVDTAFEIASLTKSFTGMAILQLAAEGKLHLHDPVSKYY